MADFAYDKFVVVAEKEWRLDYSAYTSCGGRMLTFPLTIGDIEWRIASKSSNNHFGLSLSCSSVAERCVDQVHAEIHGYVLVDGSGALDYGPGLEHFDENSSSHTTPPRHIFREGENSLKFTATLSNNFVSLLFIVRILKDRTMLPDFKSEAIKFGHLASDVKLRVADQTFHANKELLSMHSKVFDRMFNSQFKEANQEEIELKHDQADPALFEDFLLVMFQHALPNRKNLAGLFKLANFYDANNVREKCERHFRMCREMPFEERYMLALELGNEQMKNSIMSIVDNAGMKRIIAIFEKERAEASDNNKKEEETG